MTNTQHFDWRNELNKTVTHSLVTTFGLDFLLFEDKKGGDVDTIHNVRQGIWATDEARSAYENRGDYNSHAYHSHENYINKGREDKQKYQSGKLHDAYRNTTMKHGEKRHLDHIISAKEIHDDAGRVLAGLDGSELANQNSNFQSTYDKINIAKKQHSTEKFLNEVLPKSINNYEAKIKNYEQQLAELPKDAHGQDVLDLKQNLRQAKEDLEALQNIDKEAMIETDKKARGEYNHEIGMAYYTSSKFFKNTAKAAASQGFRMGARQAIGLALAEIWFELKEALPNLLRKCQINFSLEMFWGELKNTLNNIFERVKLRFKDVLNTFKDSFIAGVLSSITNTILNIFLTSTKLMGKLIRESWSNLVQVIKLLVLNPQKLAFGDLMREITRLIFASVSTILGVMLHQHLATVLTTPFGTEIAAFVSALFTGLLMVGTAYFIDYSPLMKKVWEFLNSLKNKYDVFLDHIKEINAELNAYVTNLAKIEFNLNPQELRDLSNALSHASNEIQKGQVLQAEIDRRGIELPYEMGNSASTMSWLQSKAKKLHG
ncbi:Domain of uncharacterised function (DUF1994) [Moraxella caprae]|uniref:Domain of uncharacterized function (DUF1994) n=1 Tax=Moraxella caprae TaxID=90240 RepID=A0A378QYL0_9GAMM|nr:hypothetical protein [Moraxella caprae]STZ08054.1 Domain of uncharacterised function (DUF1994) [Moraxella caprae]